MTVPSSIAFFLSTLSSYYFYELGIIVPQIVGVILIITFGIYWSVKNKIPLTKLRLVGVVISVFGICSLYGLLTLSIDIKRLLALALFTILLLTSAVVFRASSIERILRTTLFLHICAFYVQLVTYYTTGTFIDYLQPVTGELQRFFYSEKLSFLDLNVVRPTGLYVEPGTYACHVAILIALLFFSYPAGTKPSYLEAFSILSLFLSLSVYGIIYGILLAFFRWVSWWKRTLVILVCLSLSYDYLTLRFGEMYLSGHSGLTVREEYFVESMSLFLASPVTMTFGLGILDSSMEQLFSFPVNDLGLLYYIFLFGGLSSVLIILGALSFSARSFPRGSWIFLVVLLSSKLSLFNPFVYIAILIFRSPPVEKFHVRN